MQARKTISGFLLCLFLIVNGHNAIYHSHLDLAEGEVTVWPSTYSHHSHSHGYGHHHHHTDQPDSSLFNWLKQLIEDFKHADMGDKHLEVYLHSSIPAFPKQLVANHSFFFFAYPEKTSLQLNDVFSNNGVPDSILSYADPPFLNRNNYRGPPLFS